MEIRKDERSKKKGEKRGKEWSRERVRMSEGT